jgi:ABC-2 type transport system ATP-binding protein
MLASDLLPTSGGIRIDGVDLIEQPEKVQTKIGYLPDRPPLYGEMDVREYLAFAARVHGLDRAKVHKRVSEAIDIAAIGEYADDRIDALSHGYRQRVGIAQAIVHEPTLLILDEPISGLDPVQIVEMRELIRSLRGSHTTVLSSHILSEISETCDRILVIRDGEIVASGSESQLAAQMASVSSFLITVRVPTGSYRDAPIEALRAALDGVEGVESVTAPDQPAMGERVVTGLIGSDSDIREVVCKRLVEQGMGILRLEPAGKELENVFLRLTSEGAQRGGKA